MGCNTNKIATALQLPETRHLFLKSIIIVVSLFVCLFVCYLLAQLKSQVDLG